MNPKGKKRFSKGPKDVLHPNKRSASRPANPKTRAILFAKSRYAVDFTVSPADI